MTQIIALPLTQLSIGSRGRRPCAITPIEIHASAAAALSRLSGSGSSSTKRLSKLGASVGDSKALLPLSAQTPPLPLPPKPPSPASAPAVEETGDVEGSVTLPPAAAAKTKGKPAAGASKLKQVRPEKKKTKRELEAEKKALDLREKKMTRREFIQYLYEEKLKDELENAPLKRLVLKEKVIWYAEPGNAKASDSFDRRRYEMVCVFVFRVRCPCCCLPTLAYPALQLVRHGATVVPDFDHTTVTHVIFPSYMKSDGQRLGRMGYIKHSQIPESVKTVSWNWASRSIELGRIVPEQPYERIEARLPPKPVIPFRRYGAKLVDSEDEDEEVYVLRGIVLPSIDHVCSCSHSKGRIPHLGGGRGKLHQRVEQQPSPEQSDIVTATEDPLLPFYTEAKKEVAEEEVRV